MARGVTKDGDVYLVPATKANYYVLTQEASRESARRAIYAARFDQVAEKTIRSSSASSRHARASRTRWAI
jgi:hypothetical protein